MSKLLILVVAAILISCSTTEKRNQDNKTSPGYQFGKQMDERSLRAGFLERK